jgi:hypothetical protein
MVARVSDAPDAKSSGNKQMPPSFMDPESPILPVIPPIAKPGEMVIGCD